MDWKVQFYTLDSHSISHTFSLFKPEIHVILVAAEPGELAKREEVKTTERGGGCW